MAAELYTDANANHKVHETDSIQTDAPQGHNTNDIDQNHDDDAHDNQAATETAQKSTGDQKDGQDGQAEDLEGHGHNVRVLLKEDVEYRVGIDFQPELLADRVGNALGRGVGRDELILASERRVEGSKVRSIYSDLLVVGDDGIAVRSFSA